MIKIIAFILTFWVADVYCAQFEVVKSKEIENDKQQMVVVGVTDMQKEFKEVKLRYVYRKITTIAPISSLAKMFEIQLNLQKDKLHRIGLVESNVSSEIDLDVDVVTDQLVSIVENTVKVVLSHRDRTSTSVNEIIYIELR